MEDNVHLFPGYPGQFWHGIQIGPVNIRRNLVGLFIKVADDTGKLFGKQILNRLPSGISHQSIITANTLVYIRNKPLHGNGFALFRQ